MSWVARVTALIDSIRGAAGVLVSPVLMFGGPFEGLIIGVRCRGVRGGVFLRRIKLGRAEQAADVVCVASDHGARYRYADKTLRASWLTVSLLWTANILETVRGFEAVALLVVPIELVGDFLARNLVGAVAKRLGVR